MKTLLLIAALCATASAAPLPTLPVTRPKPFYSPRYASIPKSTPMATTIPGTTIDPSQPPFLPLKGSVVRVNSQFGTYEFTVEATQPAGQSLLFEKGVTVGQWEPLAYLGPQPYEQQSFAAFYSFSETNFVRAKVTPVEQPIPQTGWMPASLGHVVGTTSFVNTNLPGGVRVWSVRK